MHGLCLGFTNPVGTGGVRDACLCLGCGVVDGWLCPGYCYVSVCSEFRILVDLTSILYLHSIKFSYPNSYHNASGFWMQVLLAIFSSIFLD